MNYHKLLFVILFSSLFFAVFAQPVSVVEKPETMPRFPGCEDEDLREKEKQDCSNLKLVKYIGERIEYPVEAQRNKIEGKVVVDFVVDASGKVIEPEIINDIGGGCGSEAVRVLETMERWTPGTNNGKPVGVKMRLPVSFSIPDPNGGQFSSSYYRIYWGDMRHKEVALSDFINTANSTPIIVRDLYGKEFIVDELTLTYERGSKIKVLKGADSLNPKMLKMVSKLKSNGIVRVETLIQKDARFINVKREFNLTE